MENHILSQFNYKSMETAMCNIHTDTKKYSLVECEMFDKPSYILLWQETPASSEWMQLWLPTPLWKQLTSRRSVPEQCTFSSQIGPLPRSKVAEKWTTAPESDRTSSQYYYVHWQYTILCYHLERIPAVCRPHCHLRHPMNHHRLCPTSCWNRSLLCPL